MMWEATTLKSAVSIVMGQAPAGKDCNKEGRGTPFVKVGNFGEVSPIISEWTTDPKKMAKVNDVLLCVVGATCGKINLGADCAIGRSVAAIRPNPKKITTNFLHYFMQSKVNDMRKGSKGAAQTVISKEMIFDVPIGLPPVEEQKRIVAILDEAFSGIDQAIANTEENIQNARELFESSFIKAFILPDEGAGTKPLSELCEFIVDCEHKTAPIQDMGIASIRTPNIGFGELLLEGVNRVSKDTYEKWTRRGKPQAGDLILAREAPAGNIGIVPEGELVCLGQRTVLLRPQNELISSVYLCFLILHPIMQKRLLSHSTGATVQHINMKDIRAFPVGVLPNLTTQEEQAQKVKTLYSHFQNLKFSYEKKLAALKELKQSLLQKAFAGELTSDLSEAA